MKYILTIFLILILSGSELLAKGGKANKSGKAKISKVDKAKKAKKGEVAKGNNDQKIGKGHQQENQGFEKGKGHHKGKH
ncbi:MAG: hypothetical protein HRT88_10215 [Lentisphaeraceae bacterium]|nr:hypothetical protein [Lentisphaeraceae bacterium]